VVSTVQERCRETGEGPKEGHNDYQRAGEPALQGNTEGVWFFCLEKRCLGGTSSQYSKEDRGSLFTRHPMEKIRGNSCKLH